MTKRHPYYFFVLLLIVGCQSNRQFVALKLEDGYPLAEVQRQEEKQRQVYQLNPGDKFTLNLYTNEGEILVEPRVTEIEDPGIGEQVEEKEIFYTIDPEGQANLPLLGKVALGGLSVNDAEAYLEEKYESFYKDLYVRIEPSSKRVIVIDVDGGKVVPFQDESMTLLEALVLSESLNRDANTSNIRILRGPLHDPEVFLVDLSEVSAMKSSILQIEPGDVIYVEPARKTFAQTTRDIVPLVSILTSLTTLIVVLIR